MTLNRVKIDPFFPIPSNSRELRWFVPITVILVFVFQGNDVHVSSMEFLECFVYSRLLIINKALASSYTLAHLLAMVSTSIMAFPRMLPARARGRRTSRQD